MINKKNVYIIIFIILIFSIKILNRFDPYSQDLQNTNLGLFAKGHILGTDILGRDILSRVIQGIMISMYIILLVYILSVTIVIVIGFLISYYSKKLDYIVSYIIEVFLSIPSLIIILFIVMFMGNKFWILIFALTLTRSLRMIIFVKNEVNKLKIQNFVYMSRIMGAKSIYIFKKHIFPLLDGGDKVFLIVIDNFRYDQWKMVQQLLEEFYTIEKEILYYSILPTTTQYARNALMSGLMPLQIKEMYPQYWFDDNEENGKNLYEDKLIELLLQRYRKNISFSYNKIASMPEDGKLIEKLPQLKDNQLNVCVLNFIDMLSHTRTEMKVIKEIANTETAYRALSVNWFRYSPIMQLFKELSVSGYKVIITTDHGTVQVNKPIKVIGDRNTSTNLRYKVGKALNYNKNEVFDITNPQKAMLPSPNVSSTYIFAKNRNFMAYPNNFNYYSTYFKDSFQHGGISLEEMIVPFAVLNGKG